jgi:hypothetical protein
MMMTTNLSSHTLGPWICYPQDGCVEIISSEGVIGMAHEIGNAVMFASAPEMLDALISIQEYMENVEDGPAKIFISEQIALAFKKVYAEADI